MNLKVKKKGLKVIEWSEEGSESEEKGSEDEKGQEDEFEGE